jgi:branched-chain amino acid transport system substrate-binding protein
LKDDAHVEKIAILHDSDAFGSGGANMIAKFATEMGLKTVKREAYKTDQKDFKPYFEEFKAAGAQAMVIYTNRWPVLAQIEIQFKAFHAPFEIFGNSTAVQTTTLGVAKEAAEGVSAFTGFNIKDSEARRDFISAYKAEYKLEPDVSQSWPFDSMHILANAIAKGGEDRSKIRDAILSTKGYSGMMGTFDFDSRGDGLHEVSIVKVKSGVPSLLKLVVTGFEN